MHAIEKILARAAGKESVRAGEIINCRVDLAEVNDLYPQTILSFREMGGKRVHSPERIAFILDHYAPASTVQQAENQKFMRQFCREQGIELLFDVNSGVCHQVMVDHGLVYPGMVLIATDSHTTTHGAFGAFGTGVGATDLAVIMATGHLWLRVPEVIRIHLTGRLPLGVYAKDVILYIIGKLGADYAIYKAVEFTGPVVKALSVSERMALCNMTTEMGAKCAYIQPDEVTLDFLKGKVRRKLEPVVTDPDFQYAEELFFDVSAVSPQLAVPSSVDNVRPLSELVGTPVHQAYLGSCTGGRAEDIAVAARILKGRKVHKNTRLVVVPASRDVFLEALERGDVATLVEAGATFVTPGCAACLGTHEGILAAGETCIASTNRNFPGRMGHTQSAVYLGSPAAVAAAALNGEVTDPSQILAELERKAS
ncbi:3-isopropylmalate/(R)-2-methylmalate dehydratase large subunit [Desulfacinum hydrothermale DSM 13146]|uniref:3-isopropylmalate dehydratase large subunit n=1 Tax=Desulfacinum hydrothermale DSM 13146 TaxID=1121390 RepID=A0A1W1XH54_9BACT|nr:3-isopropylmalate dehydratase large subunit [Desulfacinum hydrothermale]SMC23323.1 3-isopropylmalate/(R)-2-methylmalate dehydratase large subunit [Desulfacinum hydrothermale DSM 13146]